MSGYNDAALTPVRGSALMYGSNIVHEQYFDCFKVMCILTSHLLMLKLLENLLALFLSLFLSHHRKPSRSYKHFNEGRHLQSEFTIILISKVVLDKFVIDDNGVSSMGSI